MTCFLQLFKTRIPYSLYPIVEPHRGSYGWVIAAVNGTPLATNHELCFGRDMNSFRNKAYGALSATVFFQIICDFHSLNPSVLLHGCNNLDLIQRLSQPTSSSTPGLTSVPHWDVTQ